MRGEKKGNTEKQQRKPPVSAEKAKDGRGFAGNIR